MPDPAALLEAAERVESACDLELGLPAGAEALAGATLLALDALDPATTSPKALWNLLWLAGDLTEHVDLYRAVSLFDAVERLFATRLAAAPALSTPLTEAAEMAFDFFFNREAPPLASARFDHALSGLGRVLAVENLLCRRAALHGLGHLREHAPTTCARAAVDALLDAVTDRELRPLARLARSGELL
ncbi:MAG TPA: hypothetical protein VII38_11740 [Polyangia bacterium]